MHCPYIVGGDFNILRHSGEKNMNFTPSHFSDLFNTIIHSLGLREIYMHGGKYTWSNKHVIPTLEKLDRVLMSRVGRFISFGPCEEVGEGYF
jgi:hypothetical protein